MAEVKFYGCYDYNDELILIEMVVDAASDSIDFGEFSVPEKGLTKSDWQAPYMEQYLNADGTEKICELYDEPEPPVKPCRFTFFIYKMQEQEGVLKTPYGDFPIVDLQPMPERLTECIELEDEEADDDEDED